MLTSVTELSCGAPATQPCSTRFWPPGLSSSTTPGAARSLSSGGTVHALPSTRPRSGIAMPSAAGGASAGLRFAARAGRAAAGTASTSSGISGRGRGRGIAGSGAGPAA